MSRRRHGEREGRAVGLRIHETEMTETARAAARDPVDEARAALYALIAQVVYAPPDQGVLAQIRHAGIFEGGDAGLPLRWQELVERCQTASPVLLENEHTDLFI